jgi:hypothetical protein
MYILLGVTIDTPCNPLEMRGFQHFYIVFCLLNVLHAGLNGADGDMGRIGAKGLVGEGQLIHSIRLMSREVRILAQKRATTPSKGFTFNFCNCHTCANHPL